MITHKQETFYAEQKMKFKKLLLSALSLVLVTGSLFASSTTEQPIYLPNEKAPQQLSLAHFEALERNVIDFPNSLNPAPVKFDEFPNVVFIFRGLNSQEINTGLKYQKHKDSITHFELETFKNQPGFLLQKDSAGAEHSFKCYFRAILEGNPTPTYENYILLKVKCLITDLDSVLKEVKS